MSNELLKLLPPFMSADFPLFFSLTTPLDDLKDDQMEKWVESAPETSFVRWGHGGKREGRVLLPSQEDADSPIEWGPYWDIGYFRVLGFQWGEESAVDPVTLAMRADIRGIEKSTPEWEELRAEGSSWAPVKRKMGFLAICREFIISFGVPLSVLPIEYPHHYTLRGVSSVAGVAQVHVADCLARLSGWGEPEGGAGPARVLSLPEAAPQDEHLWVSASPAGVSVRCDDQHALAGQLKGDRVAMAAARLAPLAAVAGRSWAVDVSTREGAVTQLGVSASKDEAKITVKKSTFSRRASDWQGNMTLIVDTAIRRQMALEGIFELARDGVACMERRAPQWVTATLGDKRPEPSAVQKALFV